MKKILFFLLILLLPISVLASNNIYSIDMDIYIDESGNASIKEIWKVKGQNGSEWYKVINNLGNSSISNFKVSMDDKPLTYKNWNIDESLSQKKGFYGINYTSSSQELCFGKYDFKDHVFTLTYDISNYVFNTNDSQVLYWTLIDRLSNVNFENFSVKVSSYYSFPDTLNVWGYGYKGYSYVHDGAIYMSNEDDMNEKYVVLLAKFPLNTFKTDNSYSQFTSFYDVYQMAEEDTFEYIYTDDNSSNKFLALFSSLFSIGIIGIIFLAIKKVVENNGYGYKDNKKLDIKPFRDIPCDKNIYYGNTLLKLNGKDYKETNIAGAIILNLIRKDVIKVEEKETGTLIKKEKNILYITDNVTNLDEYEKRLYDMLKEASKDNYLEVKEMEKWCSKNYDKYFKFFSDIATNGIDNLKSQNHIYKRTSKSECKYKNVMDDKLYFDSCYLYGLKEFLKDFSKIDSKEAIEVKLWDEYLMFAYLFGIADKVYKQFKDLYPELIENNYLGSDTILFVNSFSTTTVKAANTARSRAESYSSGGGGFSSGGGGGGSFGGGGGGSR